MRTNDLDFELIKKVQSGNKQAFNLLVVKYQYRVIKLISRYVHDNSEVYDVAQEVFIKAYRALDNFRGDSAFYTWLYRIAINTAKNYLTAQARRPPNTDVDIEHAVLFEIKPGLREMGTPEHQLLRDEIEEKVFEVIDHLPAELKTAITLRELDGLSYDEIAHVMDCPVGTVRSRIFRAREAIDNAIKPLLEE